MLVQAVAGSTTVGGSVAVLTGRRNIRGGAFIGEGACGLDVSPLCCRVEEDDDESTTMEVLFFFSMRRVFFFSFSIYSQTKMADSVL